MTAPLSLAQKQQLLGLLEAGLPRTAQPYLVLAQQVGASENSVLDQAQAWQQEGLFRRFGLVVHHRSLGISANVMVVMNIPDERVEDIGQQLAREPLVTLCYLRRRQPPQWPYNLFCMVHGRERAQVRAQVQAMLARLKLDGMPHELLFSLRAFKQRGARYSTAAPVQKQPMSAFDRKLLNRLQHGLPLSPQPWEDVAAELDTTPQALRTRIGELLEDGTLTRFGPLFDIERAGGAFTLAALSVPEARFDEVAALLEAIPEVAHNYRREHRYNMWFVLACEHPDEIARSIANIEQRTGLPVLNLPKEKTYHVGLHLKL